MENSRFRIGLWLVKTLTNYQKLTREEISILWGETTELSGGEVMTRLQFTRAISSALDLLGVVIECDRRDDYRYYIAANENNKATEWLISSSAISDSLRQSIDIRNRILLEDVPSGQYFLSTIIEAITKGHPLEMIYQKFADTEPYHCHIHPYCVKIFQQRWYLLGQKDDRSYLQTFALDRIRQLSILYGEEAIYPADFSPHDFFAHRFGVYIGEGLPAYDVSLRVDNFWAPYFRTLPLHSTQEELERYTDHSIFRYRLALTPDFINQLLSYGPHVQVLAPVELQQLMRDTISQMAALY